MKERHLEGLGTKAASRFIFSRKGAPDETSSIGPREASKMKTRKSNAGTSVVELALLLPLLMLIAIGATDFARLFYAAVIVAGSTRAGIQYGGQSNTHTGDTAGMHLIASQNASDLGGVTTSSVRECYCLGSTTEVDCITGTCAEGAPQIYVTVEAQSTFTTLVDYPGIPHVVNLTQRSVTRVQ